ncbi:MAG TPA: hypothetical protein VMR97_06925 [Acidimicrobiales bacterium]|nr:hypothetical protein [Acidimicrobiales bacterium]
MKLPLSGIEDPGRGSRPATGRSRAVASGRPGRVSQAAPVAGVLRPGTAVRQDWRIDERTRAAGRSGLAAARAALAEILDRSGGSGSAHAA